MRREQALGLVVVVILLALPLVGVHSRYGGQIQFVSYRFAEEYWKFLGTLASVAFGFYLVNVLWAEREVDQLIDQTKKVILNYLLRINTTSQAISDLVSKPFPEARYIESQKRDQEVLRLKDRIQKAGEGLENVTIDARSLRDSCLRRVYVEHVWGDLLVRIDKLSSVVNIRADFQGFVDAIAAIEELSRKARDELDGNK